jgi:hypothetical protein
LSDGGSPRGQSEREQGPLSSGLEAIRVRSFAFPKR